MRYLCPDMYASSVIAIQPELLCSMGIRVVLLDLDNTLTPTGSLSVSHAVKGWLKRLKDGGLTVYIVSNEARPSRVAHIAHELDVQYIAPAWKPRRWAFRRVLREHAIEPREVAMIGDQLFTDIFGARRLGLFAILVRPMTTLGFITTKVQRCFERPLLKWLIKMGALCMHATPLRSSYHNQ